MLKTAEMSNVSNALQILPVGKSPISSSNLPKEKKAQNAEMSNVSNVSVGVSIKKCLKLRKCQMCQMCQMLWGNPPFQKGSYGRIFPRAFDTFDTFDISAVLSTFLLTRPPIHLTHLNFCGFVRFFNQKALKLQKCQMCQMLWGDSPYGRIFPRAFDTFDTFDISAV